MSEWFKELVLKTSDEKSSVGSNPTSSAMYARKMELKSVRVRQRATVGLVV